MNVDLVATNVAIVTAYTLHRSKHRNWRYLPPAAVVLAAQQARSDVAALVLVLEWLATCPYAPPAPGGRGGLGYLDGLVAAWPRDTARRTLAKPSVLPWAK